jgi:hypothetical protein
LKPVDKKVLFLLIFAQKQTFDWISRSSIPPPPPPPPPRPSPFESQFIAHWARKKRHLGFRQVWACLSAVSVPVLLQFTGSHCSLPLANLCQAVYGNIFLASGCLSKIFFKVRWKFDHI